MNYPPNIAEVLTTERTMSLGAGSPDELVLSLLNRVSLESLFAPYTVSDVNAAMACLSGLHLYFDGLAGSHKISQDLPTPEGSFWHGVMHRREGDYSNAKYWFRRVVTHPIYPEVGQAVAATAKDEPNVLAWLITGKWDPFGFIDLVEECVKGKSDLSGLCIKIQHAEWHCLFDFCVRAATNTR